ncbi:MAG TPA: methyltransferase [Chitinophagaceae bacterium]|nr:methyltransferase [Chitinophagaceae bacterium]
MEKNQVTPGRIMHIGMGFWASKTILAAVRFKLFTKLAGKKLSGKEIKSSLGLQTTERHVYDFLDALVSLGFLQREGIFEKATYTNSDDTDMFLDQNKPTYMGGILEMGNNRLYKFWGNLEEGLLTGKAQNETMGSLVETGFEKLYESPEKLQEFMNAMSGIQMGNFVTLVNSFDFSKYKTVCDAGGADASLCIQIAKHHPNVHCICVDLPQVKPLAETNIAKFGLQDRIEFVSTDFFKGAIPAADVITMGNILHGCNEEQKLQLLKKSYEALSENGVFISIENIIDNDRRQNVFGLLMSLNMLIENGDGYDYSMNDFDKMVNTIGFRKTEQVTLGGPTSAAIAYK